MAATQDDKPASDGTPIDRFKRLVGEGSLYALCTFSQEDVAFIALVIGNLGLQIDLHCPTCNVPSTFQLPPVKSDGLNVFDPFNPPTQTGIISPKGISTVVHLKHITRALELRCARNSAHRVEVILRATDNLVSPGTSKAHGSGSMLTPQPAKYS